MLVALSLLGEGSVEAKRAEGAFSKAAKAAGRYFKADVDWRRVLGPYVAFDGGMARLRDRRAAAERLAALLPALYDHKGFVDDVLRGLA